MQSRLRDYQDPLGSFEHNLINLGFNYPGRFSGFDKAEEVSQRKYVISHANAGLTIKNEVGDNRGPLGCYMTKQGVRIVEDTPLVQTFDLDSNNGNTFTRIDLLVAEHQFVNIQGGQEATYKIIKGPIGEFTEPELDNPDYQIIIGRFFLDPQTTGGTGITYEPAKSPDSGDGPDARLQEINEFKKLNSLNQSASTYYEFSQTSGNQIGFLTLNTDGNIFRAQNLNSGSQGSWRHYVAISLKNHVPQNGTRITLLLGHGTALVNGTLLSETDFNKGYRIIRMDGKFANNVWQTIPVLMPPSGEEWIVDLVLFNNLWTVLSVSGSSYSPDIKKGMVVMVDLTNQELATFFDDFGMGRSGYIGWAICNGGTFNGVPTPDLRGRFVIMPTHGFGTQNAPALLNPQDWNIEVNGANNRAGTQKVTLTDVNISHRHSITGTTNDSSGSGYVSPASMDNQENAGFTNWVGNTNGVKEPFNIINPYHALIFIKKL